MLTLDRNEINKMANLDKICQMLSQCLIDIISLTFIHDINVGVFNHILHSPSISFITLWTGSVHATPPSLMHFLDSCLIWIDYFDNLKGHVKQGFWNTLSWDMLPCEAGDLPINATKYSSCLDFEQNQNWQLWKLCNMKHK